LRSAILDLAEQQLMPDRTSDPIEGFPNAIVDDEIYVVYRVTRRGSN